MSGVEFKFRDTVEFVDERFGRGWGNTVLVLMLVLLTAVALFAVLGVVALTLSIVSSASGDDSPSNQWLLAAGALAGAGTLSALNLALNLAGLSPIERLVTREKRHIDDVIQAVQAVQATVVAQDRLINEVAYEVARLREATDEGPSPHLHVAD